MPQTLYGLVRATVYGSGAELWKPTYDSADMEKGSSEYIPAETVEAGVAELQRLNPIPSVHSQAMARVFTDGDNVTKVLVLPHPMLLSLIRPDGREEEYAVKLFEILNDPAAGGILYLPARDRVNSLLGVCYTESKPRIVPGNTYSGTTVDAFSRHMRPTPGFRNYGLVFTRVSLTEYGEYDRVHALKLDPAGAVRRAKAAATRGKNKEKKKAAEQAKIAETDSVWAAWRKFDDLGEAIAKSIAVLRGYTVSLDYYHFKGQRHPVRRLKLWVDLADKLGPKGRWRLIPAVDAAMLALDEVRKKLGTEADGHKDLHEEPSVKQAYRWFWAEVEALKRRRKYARKKTKPAAPQPAEA